MRASRIPSSLAVGLIVVASAGGCAKILGIDNPGTLGDGGGGDSPCSRDRDCPSGERCVGYMSGTCVPVNASCGSAPGCSCKDAPPGNECRSTCGMNRMCFDDETCVGGFCYGTDPSHDHGGSADGGDAGVKAAKLPAPLRDMGIFNHDQTGRIYVVGGRDQQGTPSKAIKVYDAMTNTWTSTTDMPTARYALGVVGVVNGDIIAMGGFDQSGNAVGAVEVRDHLTASWTSATAMPTPRGAFGIYSGGSTSVQISGGSLSENGPAIATTQLYENNTQAWSALSFLPMPTPRAWLSASPTPDFTIYVGGAMSFPTTEAFSLNQNKWITTLSSMSAGRGHLATTSGCAPGVGSSCSVTFAIGGHNGTSVVADLEMYDPMTNKWSTLPPMPTAREGLVAAYIGNGADARILAIGGYDGTNTLDIVEVYYVESKTWVR